MLITDILIPVYPQPGHYAPEAITETRLTYDRHDSYYDYDDYHQTRGQYSSPDLNRPVNEFPNDGYQLYEDNYRHLPATRYFPATPVDDYRHTPPRTGRPPQIRYIYDSASRQPQTEIPVMVSQAPRRGLSTYCKLIAFSI